MTELFTHRGPLCTLFEQVDERRVAGLICLIGICATTVPHLQATVLHIAGMPGRGTVVTCQNKVRRFRGADQHAWLGLGCSGI